VYNIKIYDSGYSKSDVAAVDPALLPFSASCFSRCSSRPNDVIDSFSLGFETSIPHRRFDRAHARAHARLSSLSAFVKETNTTRLA